MRMALAGIVVAVLALVVGVIIPGPARPQGGPGAKEHRDRPGVRDFVAR
ncbi:MAG: hypothetical protein L3K17_05115 [Thermoplasmata archaeon]|nr:hypothetical protein [Thermoplasmata archaeon]